LYKHHISPQGRFPEKKEEGEFLLYKDKRDFWFVKIDIL